MTRLTVASCELPVKMYRVVRRCSVIGLFLIREDDIAGMAVVDRDDILSGYGDFESHIITSFF